MTLLVPQKGTVAQVGGPGAQEPLFSPAGGCWEGPPPALWEITDRWCYLLEPQSPSTWGSVGIK